MSNKPISAIAVFSGEVTGHVKFTEDKKKDMIKLELHVQGLKANSLHGFHVHEAGDLTDKCTSMCSHFNPYNTIHGCPGMKKRHGRTPIAECCRRNGPGLRRARAASLRDGQRAEHQRFRRGAPAERCGDRCVTWLPGVSQS